MSSLFDKFKTLVKANVPGRSNPYTPSDTYTSGADIEERLDWMEREDAKQRATAEAAEARQAADEMIESAGEAAMPHDRLRDTSEEAQAIADEADDLTRDAEATVAADQVSADVVKKAEGLLDSAEKDIAVPADASDAVKKSAQQAQELIDKARGAMGDKAVPAGESILQKASRTLDSAAKGIGVPVEATDAVKKSAQQASDLIDKARGLIGEKSAELADATDLSLPTAPPSSDNDDPSSDLDDIKRRLG